MSIYKTIYTEVEVEVDLGEFDTKDLLDELATRSELPTEGYYDAKDLLTTIWLNRRMGKDYQLELDNLIYYTLNKVL